MAAAAEIDLPLGVWMDVADAPKDGSLVDLWDGEQRFADCWWSDRYGTWMRERPQTFHPSGQHDALLPRKPTHFLVVAEPPKSDMGR